MPGPLLERADALEHIDALLRRLRDGVPGVLLVTGAAGIGKTALLAHAAARAAGEGVSVLHARASELEHDLAFGVVAQLLPGQTAAPGAQDDLHASLDRRFWQLAERTADGPVLVTVDDAQWADEASLRWLTYTARRLAGLPVLLAATIRTGEDAEHPALDGLVALEEAHTVAPRPLSAWAAATLLEEALGTSPAPAFAEACWEQTGGNPFLLSVLASDLVEAGVTPDAGNVARVRAAAPERVAAWVARRVARLGDDARAVAQAAAATGGGEDLPLVCAIAGIDEARGATAAAALVAAGLLEDAAPMRLRHPLVRAALEASQTAPERVVLHARAAELLAARGAPSGRVATHLVAAGGGRGDAAAVEHLRAAARDAADQGVPEQAVRLLERALAEPPPPHRRPEVLRELGAAALAASDDRAGLLLRDARRATDDPAVRAQLALQVAVADYAAGRHADGVATAREAVQELRDRPELREQWLTLEAFLALLSRYDLATADTAGARIRELAATLEDDDGLGARLVRLRARADAPGTSADEVAALSRERLALLGLEPWSAPVEAIGEGMMLLHAGRVDDVRRLTADLLAEARRRGSPSRHAVALAIRGAAALDTGDLDAAEADFGQAMELWTAGGSLHLARSLVGLWLQTASATGRFAAADALAAEHGLVGAVPEHMIFNPLLHGRGVLRLAQGRTAEGIADLEELGRRHARWSMTRPIPPWRSVLALALDDQGRARALVDEELELARRWGTARTIAQAQRADGLLTGGEAGLRALASAAKLLEDGPWRLDRARARGDLGAALRRAGERRAAREHLVVALDEAHACGAHVLADRLEDELRASGAKPRRRSISGLDALTPSELRVARLAAGGASNREIAQTLFVTMATVETHLSRCYRKLDVTGRGGLADALGDDADGA